MSTWCVSPTKWTQMSICTTQSILPMEVFYNRQWIMVHNITWHLTLMGWPQAQGHTCFYGFWTWTLSPTLFSTITLIDLETFEYLFLSLQLHDLCGQSNLATPTQQLLRLHPPSHLAHLDILSFLWPCWLTFLTLHLTRGHFAHFFPTLLSAILCWKLETGLDGVFIPRKQANDQWSGAHC
jgi:hypothetical protein